MEKEQAAGEPRRRRAPPQLAPVFAELALLVGRYEAKVRKDSTGDVETGHYLVEFKELLREMDLMLERVRRVEEEMQQGHVGRAVQLFSDPSGLMFDPTVAPENKLDALLASFGGWSGVDDASDEHFEIVAFAKAFYNAAWRLCVVCKERGLPGLEGLAPKGIVRVRNELVVHPEQTTQLIEGSFNMVLGEGGPKLKTQRPPDSTAWNDAGLYVNAEEFRDLLRAAMEAYLVVRDDP